MTADLAVVNGRLFRPPSGGSGLGPPAAGEPTAIAVERGRIAQLGSDADVLRDRRGPRTRVVDARGGLVLPGFEDAHMHLRSGARALDRIDLFSAGTLTAIESAIRSYAAAHPEHPWVLGRGWFYVPFPGGMPTREILDRLVLDRPAWVTAYDGHSGWANSRALAAAGIGRGTPDPRVGRIVRDPSTGEPTGALLEDAMDLVERVVPQPTEAEELDALRRSVVELHRLGITAAQDAWTDPGDVDRWRTLHAEGVRLRVRLAFQMPAGIGFDAWRARLDEYEPIAFPLRGGDRLDAGILKGFVDGVVESRTAAMLEPYEGDGETGAPRWDPAELDAFVAEADRRGWQVELHAIGDAGIRMALDAFERAGSTSGAQPGPLGGRLRRHRVEHIEAIAAADIPRFGRLGVVASMQPLHGNPSPNQLTIWAGNVGPERASRAWAARSIRAGGAVLAFGSDWPVVPPDPLLELHAAVTRQTADFQPPDGWNPGERLPLPEALMAYGHGAAFAAFAERRRGTLAPGLDADLVVLDRDLLEAGGTAILGTRVLLTVVGGVVVHDAGELG